MGRNWGIREISFNGSVGKSYIQLMCLFLALLNSDETNTRQRLRQLRTKSITFYDSSLDS
jgi:hypothetical protein